MLNSDTPEIREQAEAYLAAAQNQQTQKKGILSKIGDFFFPPAASAEPDILNRKSVITGDFPQNQFPFRSMAEMAAANDLALNNMYTTPNIPFDANTFDDATTSGKLPIVMSPNINYLDSKNFPKIEFGGTVLEDDNTGITKSAAAQEFEPPFQIIGGQKVYLDDKLGTAQALEKANFFQEPKGIMTQAKDFFTKTVPSIASSAIDFIPGMRFVKGLDKFNTLPYQDRKFIKSVMDMKGIPGSGIYVDPNTGSLKDFRGKNVRSLFGNYAESIEKGYADKVTSLEKSKDRWTEKYGGLDNINEYGKTWNEMNKRNLAEFTFLTNMKNKFDQQKEELKQKIKKTKSINIHGGDSPTAPPGGGDGRYGVGADGQKSYDFGQGFGVSATTGGPVSNRTGRGRQDY
jgi:hypothetical protein